MAHRVPAPATAVPVRHDDSRMPADGGIVNSVSFGPVLNTAAVALTAFGNVPTERVAQLIGILYGQSGSAGFVDRASTRLAGKLTEAGFDTAMLAALLAESVLHRRRVSGAGRHPRN